MNTKNREIMHHETNHGNHAPTNHVPPPPFKEGWTRGRESLGEKTMKLLSEIQIHIAPDGAYLVHRDQHGKRFYLGLYWSLVEAYQAIQDDAQHQAALADAEHYDTLADHYKSRATAARVRGAFMQRPPQMPVELSEEG